MKAFPRNKCSLHSGSAKTTVCCYHAGMFHAAIELLEPRALLSAAPAADPLPLLAIPQNINVSRRSGNQSEGAIAIDPTNPSRVFALSNIEFGAGVAGSVSSDGGVTWSTRIIGNGRDKLPSACCDPTVAFDESGNLYAGYMDVRKDALHILTSTDGGATFRKLMTFAGDVDQPTITAGAGTVWVTFQKDGRIAASGARVTGLGTIGKFSRIQYVPGVDDGNFGDITIGPAGQVMVTWLNPIDTTAPSDIYVSVDRNGLAPGGFSKPVFVTATGVAAFRAIRAQRNATIDAEPDLEWDRSGGVARGRVYLVYTAGSRNKANHDTNIYLRHSSDNGATWSRPIRVNDDASKNSQFLPRIVVDQTTGNIAMSWHDSRNDNGVKPGSTNLVPNDDAEFWGATAQPTAAGVILSPNFQISAGVSNAERSRNGIDYGDYTGLAFHGGVMLPYWADNSNSTGDNVDGKLRALDMYTARITPVFA